MKLPPAPTCQNCAHFKNDPAHIEETFRGLTAMSSGFASVRDQDGICNRHQLYLSARDNCPDHLPTSSTQPIDKASIHPSSVSPSSVSTSSASPSSVSPSSVSPSSVSP